MKKTQEQRFLEVKEGLDYYRLPTIFPIEATDLISQLLSLIKKQDRRGKQNIHDTNKSEQMNEIDGALRHQIGKVTKENNKLHMDLISARQQISAMQYSMEKHVLERKGGKEQLHVLIEAKKRREDQLFEQLTQVKFKYNQLMDLVHEDSAVQKKYIKRLMKHKRMEIDPKDDGKDESSSKKKGPSQTTSELEAKVALISNKLANREAEITRLQKKMEYDGLNLNKILKDFQKNRTDGKINTLEEQVRYLQDQNLKMKKEVDLCRKTGGRHEALRQQIRKNHQTINKISAQNKELTRKMKQKDYDCKYKGYDDDRKVSKAENKAKQIISENLKIQYNLSDTKKKNEFLEKQISLLKEENESLRQENLNKQIEISQMKNKEEGGNVLNHYEAQTFKQKLFEAETTIVSQQRQIEKLIGQNKYFRDEGLLKSEAIDNLEKIVDQLMRKNNYQKGNIDSINNEVHATNIQNTIILRKNLNEVKQALSLMQGEKTRIEKQLMTCSSRLEQKLIQNTQLNDEVNRLKIKVMEMKSDFEEVLSLQRNCQKLELDYRREQNSRMKAEAMLEQSDNQKTKLRRELQEVTQQFEIYEKKAKNHINNQKLQLTQLDETNHLLDIRMKQKQKKVIGYQQKIQDLQSKVKLLRDQVTLLQDQKHSIIREKHRVQKRYQELVKNQEDAFANQKMSSELSKSDHNADLLWYKKQFIKLQEKIEFQNQHINELTKLCESRTTDKEALVSEKIMLVRENDQLKLELNKLERVLISEGRKSQ